MSLSKVVLILLPEISDLTYLHDLLLSHLPFRVKTLSGVQGVAEPAGGWRHASKVRLRIFEVCMDALVANFRVYGPLLGAIKAEYDRAMQYYPLSHSCDCYALAIFDYVGTLLCLYSIYQVSFQYPLLQCLG